jgi:hypothetical protein
MQQEIYSLRASVIFSATESRFVHCAVEVRGAKARLRAIEK